MTTYIIIDKSSSPIDTPILQQIAAACEEQLNTHVADSWGGNAIVNVGTDAAPGQCGVFIFDTSDVANAAGYHDRTPTGDAYIRVFRDAAPTLTQGPYCLSSIISHELVEAFIDPGANRWADRADGTEEALEGADRVEDVSYRINDVDVSDFLLPTAFDPGASRPYSYRDSLDSQTGMTPGGYVILRQNGPEIPSASKAATVPHVRVEHGPAVSTEKAYLAAKEHLASRRTRRGVRG